MKLNLSTLYDQITTVSDDIDIVSLTADICQTSSIIEYGLMRCEEMLAIYNCVKTYGSTESLVALYGHNFSVSTEGIKETYQKVVAWIKKKLKELGILFLKLVRWIKTKVLRMKDNRQPAKNPVKLPYQPDDIKKYIKAVSDYYHHIRRFCSPGHIFGTSNEFKDFEDWYDQGIKIGKPKQQDTPVVLAASSANSLQKDVEAGIEEMTADVEKRFPALIKSLESQKALAELQGDFSKDDTGGASQHEYAESLRRIKKAIHILQVEATAEASHIAFLASVNNHLTEPKA